ncbi:hypothetical protein NC651_026929 [Populus alba x Populus x berolinensis]|nr:hypothetical protein NC651_026929 [Populus alba x Populus x berolinensis]
MNTYQAGRGQQKEATSSYKPYDDRQPKQSSKWSGTPKPRQPGGKLRQASTTKHSSYQTSTNRRQPYPSLEIQASSAGQTETDKPGMQVPSRYPTIKSCKPTLYQHPCNPMQSPSNQAAEAAHRSLTWLSSKPKDVVAEEY